MMTVMSVSSSKICFIAGGLVLLACNVVCVVWLFISKAQKSFQSPTPCRTMSSDDMPYILGNLSSEAHCFFKVKGENYMSDAGPVRWDHDSTPRGISLDNNGTKITVDSSGHYIVFVQAIFINENYTGNERLRIDLITNDTDVPRQVVAFDEREVKGHSQEMVLRLSFMVLLELVKGQYIIVEARHRNKFDYSTPISTFFTMVKYTNLS